ncbi:MAG: CrcB family protein [Acidimicrobiales bacterium]
MPANVTLPPKRFALALGAVLAGGGVGTVIRDLALKLQNIPTGSTDWTTQVPWVLLVINVLGVYVATWLLRTALRAHDPNDPWRLLLITGLLGGFTSYSSLVVAWAAIWHLSVPIALGVAVGSLASGVLAAWLGLRHHS